jgi:hypothetical protein
MSHAVAAALVTGTGGAEAFTAATLTEPAIGRLRGRVKVSLREVELPPPNDRPARVTLELRDGATVSSECLSAVGGPDRPLPLQVVFDKATSLAAPVYPKIRPVLESLAGLAPARRGAGWADIVSEFCGQPEEISS